ncbi:MAG: hypothetical protein ACRDHP_07495, partial [Ktedonobacterales bacterium]
MRERRVMDAARTRGWWRSRMARRGGIAAIVTVIWLVPLVSVSAWAASRHPARQSSATATSTVKI